MNFKNIILNMNDGVATITLNRPEAWNALCSALNTEMLKALNSLQYDESVRVLIITGGSKVFAAGADIKEMADATPMDAQRTADQGQEVNNMIENMPFPVIAAVNGPALGGGCEMTLACDFRIVGENASFAFPEVSLGIIPGAGGTQRITGIIGISKAKEMILLGKKINGTEAGEIGLATNVVSDEKVMDAALEMAERIKKMPAYAVAMGKRAIHLGELYGFAAGKQFERDVFSLCFANPDQAEGMEAFKNKKSPNYKNKR